MLETNRLIIKAPTLHDVDALFAIHNDPENQKFNPKGPDTDIDKFTDGVKEWIMHHEHHGFGYYVLIDKIDQEIFGVCGLKFNTILDNTYLNIYYRINSNKTRKGFVKEAANEIINHVNQITEGKYKLVAQTKYNNIPSIKTAESLGFEMDSTFDDVLEKGNVFLFR
ncbi:GNAT family N-acetyltransferase [Macrococcus capreoli]|uniref:GNAT family N-acetyltransferase n=1 Tax=Macrococcus capreoli TaxID=2982690 RepID=UPI0021D5718A|nr:GNAT family N-acetyltransferase [Macrococcus sp. TMW 2.2395]MCU7558003.1 GNAT family N-acetyltransferase [Macrococcus sp. TMW 2.2395]